LGQLVPRGSKTGEDANWLGRIKCRFGLERTASRRGSDDTEQCSKARIALALERLIERCAYHGIYFFPLAETSVCASGARSRRAPARHRAPGVGELIESSAWFRACKVAAPSSNGSVLLISNPQSERAHMATCDVPFFVILYRPDPDTASIRPETAACERIHPVAGPQFNPQFRQPSPKIGTCRAIRLSSHYPRASDQQPADDPELVEPSRKNGRSGEPRSYVIYG